MATLLRERNLSVGIMVAASVAQCDPIFMEHSQVCLFCLLSLGCVYWDMLGSQSQRFLSGWSLWGPGIELAQAPQLIVVCMLHYSHLADPAPPPFM